MADVLAEALVELEPDIRTFAKRLSTDVRRLNKSIDDSMRQAETRLGSLGDTGADEFQRIADVSERANQQVLQGWRETAQGFEKVYKDSVSGVERAVDVSFKTIIRQQEAQAKAAETQLRKLNEQAERETRQLLRQEETQAREISQIITRFDKERERESARLAAAQRRQAQAAAREVEKINQESARQARRLAETYEIESRNGASSIERNIGGALRRVSSGAGRGVIDLSVNTAGLAGAVGQATKLGAVLSTLGIGALAGQAGIGGIAAVASSLSQLVGVTALLPAVGGTAAVSLGVLALGVRGVGEAISETDPEDYAKALERLAPSAREFTQAVRDAQPAAEDFQRAIQQELFVGLGREVDRLADVLLPRFRGQLAGVASEFNDIAFEFTSFITSVRTLSDVDRLLVNTRRSTDIFTAAVQPLLRSLRDVGAVGTEFLPILAGEFTVAALEFSNFIARARESGALQQFIQNGIDATKELIGVVGNLGRTFGGVMRASRVAGGDFLGALRQMTDALDAAVNSVEGQETLTSFFESAIDVGEDLLPLLGSIARVIGQDIAPLLADVGGNVLPAFTRTINDLGNAISTAAPGITEFSSGFADFLDALSAEGVLDTVGSLVNVLGTELGGALRDIAPVLGEVIVKLGSELRDILPKLIPAVADFANSFGELLKPALDLLGVIGEIASQLVLPALTRLADTLTPIIDKIGSKIETVLVPALPKIGAAVDDAVDALGPLIDALGDGLVESLELLVDVAPDAINAIKSLADGMTPLLQTIGPVVGAINDINGALNSLVDSVPGLRSTLGEGGIFGVLTAGTNPISLFQGLHNSVDGLFGLIVGEFPDAERTFTDGLGRIKGTTELTMEIIKQRGSEAFDGLLGLITSHVPAFTDIFLTGLGTMQDGSRNILGQILADLTDHFGRMEQTVADHTLGIADKTAAAMERLRDSTARAFAETEARVAVGIVNVANETSKLPGLVQNSLGAIGSVLYPNGAALISGFIAGMKSREFAAREAAAALMRVVAGLFPGSPAKEGPFSGRGWTPFRGASLVAGFADGMINSVDTARDAAALVARVTGSELMGPLSPTSDALTSLTGGARTAQSISRLTTTDGALNRIGSSSNVASDELASTNELGSVIVNVRIGERELEPMITEVIDDRNRSVKRSVTTRARRTL